jgi:hypothetical protein
MGSADAVSSILPVLPSRKPPCAREQGHAKGWIAEPVNGSSSESTRLGLAEGWAPELASWMESQPGRARPPAAIPLSGQPLEPLEKGQVFVGSRSNRLSHVQGFEAARLVGFAQQPAHFAQHLGGVPLPISAGPVFVKAQQGLVQNMFSLFGRQSFHQGTPNVQSQRVHGLRNPRSSILAGVILWFRTAVFNHRSGTDRSTAKAGKSPDAISTRENRQKVEIVQAARPSYPLGVGEVGVLTPAFAAMPCGIQHVLPNALRTGRQTSQQPFFWRHIA